MFNPKSTIYQNGWLDLVFANRNKSYGAYELRRNYNKRLGRALLISSILGASLISFPLLKDKFFAADTLVSPSSFPTEKETIVQLTDLPVKKIEVPEAAAPKAEPIKTKSLRFVKMVAVSTPVLENPLTIKQIETAVVGLQNINGTETSQTVNANPAGPIYGNGDGINPGAENGNAIVPFALLEKYPEFPGGIDAFIKFLRNNLRYPDRAVDSGIAGKVFVSFVVEKDGRLTDVKVLKGIGYGCDEEATRVLRKSPLWNPGIQNKREVRVQYTIPLVFELGE